jgi:hypothetical protein
VGGGARSKTGVCNESSKSVEDTATRDVRTAGAEGRVCGDPCETGARSRDQGGRTLHVGDAAARAKIAAADPTNGFRVATGNGGAKTASEAKESNVYRSYAEIGRE